MLLLIVALIASNYPPLRVWPLSLIGLGFNYILLLSLLMIGLQFIFSAKWSILHISILIGILVFSSSTFNLKAAFNKNQLDATKGISLINHNLQSFGLFGPHFEIETSHKIFDFYKENQTDIAVFQEFFNTDRKKMWNFSPYDSLNQILKLPHQYIYYSVHHSLNYFGLAIFSKYPIIDTGNIFFEARSTNQCIWADININDKILRVYNFHLASLHLPLEDIEAVQNIKNSDIETQKRASKNIIGRIKSGYERRLSQLEIVTEHVKKCPYPVILLGDLNDGPVSYSYNKLSAFLNDAHKKHQFGFGSTYNGNIPFLRIDYAFSSDAIKTIDFKTHRKKITDHFPLQLKFEIIE